jgi:hypothetical protein
MTFGARGTGGKYIHDHEFKILFREFYGSVNTPHTEWPQDATGSSYSWKAPDVVSGTTNSAHLSATGQGSSAIAQQVLHGKTRMANDVPPYQVIYCWRRTA